MRRLEREARNAARRRRYVGIGGTVARIAAVRLDGYLSAGGTCDATIGTMLLGTVPQSMSVVMYDAFGSFHGPTGAMALAVQSTQQSGFWVPIQVSCDGGTLPVSSGCCAVPLKLVLSAAPANFTNCASCGSLPTQYPLVYTGTNIVAGVTSCYYRSEPVTICGASSEASRWYVTYQTTILKFRWLATNSMMTRSFIYDWADSSGSPGNNCGIAGLAASLAIGGLSCDTTGLTATVQAA